MICLPLGNDESSSFIDCDPFTGTIRQFRCCAYAAPVSHAAFQNVKLLARCSPNSGPGQLAGIARSQRPVHCLDAGQMFQLGIGHGRVAGFIDAGFGF
jgi:hypothetical protein